MIEQGSQNASDTHENGTKTVKSDIDKISYANNIKVICLAYITSLENRR